MAAALVAGGLIAAFTIPVAAEPSQPSSYQAAVQQAYALIEDAASGDVVPAVLAYRAMLEGTGTTQPEILEDLRTRPPLYADARLRMQALIAALQQPPTTSDPLLAQQRLHDVLSSSRFDALRRPPSILDRFSQWVQDRVNELLRLIFGRRGGPQPPAWWLYLLGFAVVAAVAFVVFRSARGRFTQSVGAVPQGPRPAADYFDEADALASRGDRVGAIRALCAGVAGKLEGERSWEGSPLTIREIFQRGPDFASLRALLAPFEAAVYGGRDVDAATYERAARAAEPFRRPGGADAA